MFAANASSTELLLIRHGETDWNVAKRMQGFSDIPLNRAVTLQAERLVEKIVLHHPDVATTLYTSDLKRAIVTAEKVALSFKKMSKDITIKYCEDLREINWGKAEGLSADDKNSRYQSQEQVLNDLYIDRKERWNHTPIPNSESLNQLVTRAKNILTEIARYHPGEKVAIFTHGRLINTLILETSNNKLSPELPNCAIAHFRFLPDETNHKQFQFIKIEDLLQSE